MTSPRCFVCSDPAKFSDSGYDGYSHVGNEARTEGYVKRVIFGEYGEIMPAEVGGALPPTTATTTTQTYPPLLLSVVSCSAVMRVTVRVRASPLRTRVPPPRIRLRSSALAFALSPNSRSTRPRPVA